MIRLRALGKLDLSGEDGEPLDTVLAQPKRLALLLYLAVAGPGFQRRDTLLGLFWMEADQDHARGALSQSLYFLRRHLGRDCLKSRGNDEITVDASRLWCDVVAFEQALDAGKYQEALELYDGELLPGFYLSEAPGWERWLESERDRLRARVSVAAWSLADRAAVARDAAAAARWGRRAVELRPYDEVQLRRFLTLLGRLGNRTAAAHEFEAAARRFADDYGGELSAATRSLMDGIHAGEIQELAGVASPTRDLAGKSDATEPQATEPYATEPSVAAAQPRVPPPVRLRLSRIAGLSAALSAAVLVAGVLWSRGGDASPGQEADAVTRAETATASSTASARLAVLPLVDRSPDTDTAYFAVAMTDQLIWRLSEIPGLRVIAQSSSSTSGVDRSPAEISRRLGARYLLEGSVERAGPHHRIVVRLLASGVETPLWSESFETGLEDLPSVQGEIADGVATALSIDVADERHGRLRTAGTDDPAAREAYLKGRYFLGKSDETSMRTALDYFRAALDLDPAYARAWSGLSDAYDHLAGIGALSSEEAYPRARAAAERALEIDPDMAEAHASLAMALSHHYWESAAAERHWLRAIELNPSHARARRTYAGHLRNLGRFDEALAQATVARDIDPLPFYSHFELLVIPYFQRRYEEVVAQAAELATVDPSYGYAHFLRALALVQLDRPDQALAALNEVDPDGTWTDARLIRAHVHAGVGRTTEAREILRTFEGTRNPDRRGFERAVIHVALGELDLAMAALEEAYEARSFRLRLLAYEPLFDPLRTDPRFLDLLDRLGLGEVPAAGP